MNKHESKYFNTAKKMDEALIALLAEKDFEFITVMDVCKKAGVNRSTFYLHYENTNDVLEEVINNLTTSFCKHFNVSEANSSAINKTDLSNLYFIRDRFLIPYLNFIKENKQVYKALRGNPSLFRMDTTYSKMFHTIFSPILNRFGLEEKWHGYLMDFYMHGLSALVLDWVYDDCKIDVGELSLFIKGIVGKDDKIQIEDKKS